MLQLKTFATGFLNNNCVLVYEETTGEGLLVDPSFDPEKILRFIETEKIQVKIMLFTHGHFDHFAGLHFLLSQLNPPPNVGLHPADLPLWQDGGGSKHFGIPMELPIDPDLLLEHGQQLKLGGEVIEVRHTPGHSAGSLIFYFPAISTAVVGDLIFKRGVGRTDLDGGDFDTLEKSIQEQVYTLPPETKLIPGHGPYTTVMDEIENNPYVRP